MSEDRSAKGAESEQENGPIDDLEVTEREAEDVTGGRVEIAATNVPKFSAGSQLKAAVKGS